MGKINTGTVRMGIIGCGGMANAHVHYYDDIEGLTLTAACDLELEKAQSLIGERDAKAFTDAQELMDSGLVDAVLIATPHYAHPVLAEAAFKAGLHVLVEKPVAVTAADAEAINQVHANYPDLTYAAMFNQRTHPVWRMVKHYIDSGKLGTIKRVQWNITNWFRTQAYYNSGGWRATWAGEGGGVLINQCPHNLDLIQWFVGMPEKVTAVVGLGKHHDIEVEDEVTAILEYPGGAVGTFITTTGEAPGENRLTLVGEKGTLIAGLGGGGTLGGVGGGSIQFREVPQGVREYSDTTEERFAGPVINEMLIEPGGKNEDHKAITRNFVNHLLKDEPLIAPAEEGIHGLELGNAMLFSGLLGEPVSVPTDRAAFKSKIQELINASDKS